jgi:site-specific recombinase XerD
MEVLYSTGIRRMEVVNLKLHDIEHQLGTAFIHLGKGKKTGFYRLENDRLRG